MPWEDPIPLTRAWCLWELLCSVNGHTQLSVQMPPRELDTFEEALKTGHVHHVTRALSNIDVRRSEAFLRADRDMILAAVESTVGSPGLNRIASLKLRQWFVATGMELVARLTRPERASSVLLTKLLLLCNTDLGFDCVDVDECLQLSKDYVQDVVELHGPLDVRSLDARQARLGMQVWKEMRDNLHNLNTVGNTNILSETLPLFEKLAEDRRLAHPGAHPATADVLNFLGLYLKLVMTYRPGGLEGSEGRADFEKSRQHFREACEMFATWLPQQKDVDGDSE